MKYILIIVLSFIFINANAQIELAEPTEDPIIKNIGISNASTIKIIESYEESVPSLQFPILSETPKPPIGDNKRRIYFIHGLSGDGTSWTDAADALRYSSYNVPGFTARECKTSRVDYNLCTSGDLRTAGDCVRDFMELRTAGDALPNSGMNPDPTYNFLIGHSQGGVVGRAILDLDFFHSPNPYGVYYGGLVTISSPLQGAMILNNRDDILHMANNACSDLIAGHIESAIPDILVVRKIMRTLAYDLGDTLCDIASYNVLPLFFKDNMTPITEHYRVGAQQIADFNTNATNASLNADYNEISKVAFYGYEPPENLLWRTVNWILNDPNGMIPGGTISLPIWGANDDFHFLNNSIIPTRNKYLMNKVFAQNEIDGHLLIISESWWVPTAAIFNYYNYYYKIPALEEKRDAWDKGVKWFDNKAIPQWSTIIGAREYTADQKYICFCRMDLDGPYEGMIVDNASECTEHSCVARPYTEYTLTIKPSDGVVLNESAKELPGATHDPVEVKGYEISPGVYSGSSHMQIRNDKGLKTHLNLLMEGEYGDFFETLTQ